ncbi:Steroid reductase [Ceraceosorus bombacis]|uniref:Steroid reductase n=1 Tax=Ceraceosorus bombacis TaxID=401625 RepID=A0A0P1BN85_9BASI|nr:Steroid reductase [Ceraceosorus bombacis]
MTSAFSSLLAFGGFPAPSFSKATAADVYVLAVLIFKYFPLMTPLVKLFNAPHGRFAVLHSKLNLPGNAAWLAMEIWSPLLFALSVASPVLSHSSTQAVLTNLVSPSWSRVASLPTPNLILAAAYIAHYTHRAVLQPLRSPARSPIHLSVALSATAFNLLNGFVMGSWIGGRSPSMLLPSSILSVSALLPRNPSLTGAKGAATAPLASPGLLPESALYSPLFWMGVIGWAVGFAGNVYHDEILMDIRRPKAGEADPASKAYISFPNYLCEWIEWSFYALGALSLSAISPLSRANTSPPLVWWAYPLLLLSAPPALFVLSEITAMLPRALNGHAWYRAKFGVQGDGKGGRYPAERKAIFPGLL